MVRTLGFCFNSLNPMQKMDDFHLKFLLFSEEWMNENRDDAAAQRAEPKE